MNQRQLAIQIVDHLRPHCTRIEIAGALRRDADLRGVPVKDIDIVAEPTFVPIRDMFNDVVRYTTLWFAGAMGDLLYPPFNLEEAKGGARYQQFTSAELGCTIDLFLVQPQTSWGALLAIRTGPADFAKLCVTSRLDGGAMPLGMQQADGVLLRGGQPVETDTEEAWFKALGIPCWAPQDRTAERLRRYLERKRI